MNKPKVEKSIPNKSVKKNYKINLVQAPFEITFVLILNIMYAAYFIKYSAFFNTCCLP